MPVNLSNKLPSLVFLSVGDIAESIGDSTEPFGEVPDSFVDVFLSDADVT